MYPTKEYSKERTPCSQGLLFQGPGHSKVGTALEWAQAKGVKTKAMRLSKLARADVKA